MRGPTITPSELAQASEAYAREGTYAAAARTIGRDPAVTRRALVRSGEPSRLVVYQRALDDGLDQAQRALVAAVETARAAVAAQVVPMSDGTRVYRTDALARMVDTLAHATDTLGRLALQAERRRLLRAQRLALRARSPSAPTASVVILPAEEVSERP